jgi:hypothetical protein
MPRSAGFTPALKSADSGLLVVIGDLDNANWVATRGHALPAITLVALDGRYDDLDGIDSDGINAFIVDRKLERVDLSKILPMLVILAQHTMNASGFSALPSEREAIETLSKMLCEEQD